LSAFAAGLGVLVALGFIGSGQSAQALTNCSVSDNEIALDSEEAQFLTLINTYRAQNGRGALTASTNLNRASAWMARDLAVNRRFSHTDSLGRSPSTRVRDCDYPQGAGENIAAGTVKDTAAEAFEMWRNSSGHNANMLGSSYRQIGIARYYDASAPYRWYWVTNFGSTDDGTDGTSGGSGGGGSATATPTPTPTQAAANAKAQVTSPSPGSTLPGSSVTFQWSAGQGAQEYYLYVGTSQGGNNLYSGSQGTATSRTVSGLPSNGSTVHARLWTRFSSGWQYNDYSFTAWSSSGGGGGGGTATATPTPTPTPTQTGSTSAKAEMISPVPGSTLDVNNRFTWTAGQNASGYYLYFGTRQGSSNMGAFNVGTSTSADVNGFPRDGRTIWVRLWTQLSGGWQYNDYQYTAPS
jgi:uncharacterized protein YkwD